MTLAASRIAEIRERAEAAKHSPWTHSPQEGRPGHCVQAQVWDENGHALADLEPTLIPELATATAAHIAGLHPQEAIDICDHISALEAENAALRKALEPPSYSELDQCFRETANLPPLVKGWAVEHSLGISKAIIAWQFWRADRAAALAQQEGQT